jgi:hypothetical protein
MQPEMGNDLAQQERARLRQLRAERVQRRRLALGIVALGVIVLIVALVIGLSGDDEVAVTTTESTGEGVIPSGTYTATLTGADSVPSVQTSAQAAFTLTYDAETDKLSFVLEITKKLTTPIVASIYQGAPGTDGDAVYTLWIAEEPNEGTFLPGLLAEGTVVEMDLIGPLQGGTLADLIELIEEGSAYVSVGNKSHPVDAIRGQIEEGSPTETSGTTETSGETETTE